MDKIKFNIGWVFVIIFVLIQILFKDDIQLYANIALICIMLPFFIFRLVKSVKEKPEEKKNILINIFLLIIFLIIGYLIITEKFNL